MATTSVCCTCGGCTKKVDEHKKKNEEFEVKFPSQNKNNFLGGTDG